MNILRNIFLFLFFSCIHAAEPVAALRSEVNSLVNDVGVLTSACNTEMDRLHAGRPVHCVNLVMDRAVMDQPASLRIWISPVLPVQGTIAARGLTGLDSDVEMPGLTITGDGKAGSAKGLVTAIVERGQDWNPALEERFRDQLSITIGINIDIRWKNGRVYGTWKWTPQAPPVPKGAKALPSLPSRQGEAEGTVQQFEKLEGIPFPTPSANLGAKDLYILACNLETEADRAYIRFRNLVLMRRQSLSWKDAISAGMPPQVVRPTLQFEKSSLVGPPPALDAAVETIPGESDAAVVQAFQKVVAEATKYLVSIRTRVTHMKNLVQQKNLFGAETALPQAKCDDPEFGPWFGEGGLPSEKGVTQLPADAGTEGLPVWAAVTDWSVAGPFQPTEFSLRVSELPDQVFQGDETFRIRMQGWKDISINNAGYTGSELSAWQSVIQLHSPGVYQGALVTGEKGTSLSDSLGFGLVSPPKCFGFNPYYRGMVPTPSSKHMGFPNSTSYLRCRIRSSANCTLWAGVGVAQRGRLWLEDQLLWESPATVDPLRMEETGLVRIPFQAGINHLTLRIDVDWASPAAWLRLCLRGVPRTANAVKERSLAIQTQRQAVKPEVSVGWRGDGTGIFPGAQPPVVFDIKAKQNVLWQVPTDYFGNATPVPVPGSDRLFITVDPCWLVCLAKSDGHELWRRPVSLIDLMPEEDRKKGWELHDAWWKARRIRDVMPKYLGVGKTKCPVPKWLTYQWYWAQGSGIWADDKGPLSNERDGTSPDLVVLLDKRDELEKAPDPNSVQDELNKVQKQIEKIQSARFAKDPNSPMAKDLAIDKAEATLIAHMKKYSNVSGMGGGYWQDYTGWMFGTPVTDGKHVWVKSGSDVAACFDLDGKEIWKVQIWGCTNADHSLSSPRLAGGLLLMYLNNCDREVGNKNRIGAKILALDAATGEKRWETRDIPDGSWHDATPGIMTLSNGTSTMQVIVTDNGCILRLEDGKLLVKDCAVGNGFASPLVFNDVVVFGAPALCPVQYLMENRDVVGFRRLWSVRGSPHGVLDSGGAIVVDGVIQHVVGISPNGERGGGGMQAWKIKAERGPNEGWRAVEGYDVQTGSYVAAVPILRKGGNQWTPASVGEKHVYHIAGDHIFQTLHPKAPMDLVVLTKDRQPLRLANNAIDRTYGSAVLDGDRIYLRGYYGVTCVGYTGDEGRRFESRIIARNLLDEVSLQKPVDSPIQDIAASGGGLKEQGKPVATTRILPGQAPHTWWILGPFPGNETETVLKGLGIGSKPITGGETLKIGETAFSPRPLRQSVLKIPAAVEWKYDEANLTDIHRVRRAVDLGLMLSSTTACLVIAELKNEKTQVLRFEPDISDAQTWIAGVKVNAGDRIRLNEGVYQLVMMISPKTIPTGGLWLSPRFWSSDSLAEEQKYWSEYGQRIRPYLDTVQKLAPESPEAQKAQVFLK